jgi:gas vesicle structural protein
VFAPIIPLPFADYSEHGAKSSALNPWVRGEAVSSTVSSFAIYQRDNTMAVEKVNSSSSLAEVVDRILDKGIVVDAWVRVSLVGIELLAIEARVVIASVETYLKYAEAVGLTTQAAVPAA